MLTEEATAELEASLFSTVSPTAHSQNQNQIKASDLFSCSVLGLEPGASCVLG